MSDPHPLVRSRRRHIRFLTATAVPPPAQNTADVAPHEAAIADAIASRPTIASLRSEITRLQPATLSGRRHSGVAFAVVLVACATVASVSAGCQDAGCSCQPQSTMTCRGSPSGAVVQLPAVTSSIVTSVFYTKYNLGTLANASFSGQQQSLQQVVTLSLDNNGITAIERNALSGLTGLVFLSVASNNVQQLPARVFEGSVQLQQLDLHNNGLDVLDSDTFAGLAQLRQLDLSSNTLRSLPPAAFAPLQSLERLDLSFNQIESLSGDFLSGLTSLTWLSLSSNRLTSLSTTGVSSPFSAAERLQALDVSHNRLKQLPTSSSWLANLTSLVALNLSGSYAPCDCGGALALRTWLDSTVAAAPIKSDWVANPARSGTCSAPPSVANTFFVNVPAVSLACTATTTAPTTISIATSSPATTATAMPPSPAASVAGATPPSTLQALSQGATSAAAESPALGGSTLAIVLGCSVGAVALLVVILVTWSVRRRLKRGLQQQSVPTSPKVAIAQPIATDSANTIAAAIFKSDGGGWSNGAFTCSPSTESLNEGGGDRAGGQPAQTSHLQPPPHLAQLPPTRTDANVVLSVNEATTGAGLSQGYYDRVAADLKEGSTGAPRSPVRMNGLLPYAYTRQNSARTAAIEQARTNAMLSLGSSSVSSARRVDDLDRASAFSASTMRFYSSHGALSPSVSSSNGGSDAVPTSTAADDRRFRRSLPRSTAVSRNELAGRNATLTSSLRLGAAVTASGRGLSQSLSGTALDQAGLQVSDGSAIGIHHIPQATPHQPAFWSQASDASNIYENAGPLLAARSSAAPPPQPHESTLQPLSTPRTPSLLDVVHTQFSFSPQQRTPELHRPAHAPPPPADYSTMGSSRSLSAASGSLHSGHGGGGRSANNLKRFLNDTPV